MILKNFFIKCIFFSSLFGLSFFAYSKTMGKCGDMFLRIAISEGKNNTLRQFRLYGKKEEGAENLLYATKKGSYFFVRCIKNKEKKPLVLFQEIYGLDAGPEDTFGAFDVETNNMLINPRDWPIGNQELIEKLLGRAPPFVNGRSGGFFCCFNGDY
ncbi:MAG: hypothetical protein P4L79_16215 [Legionella sp.]|uniref:hypothetical protein n=1 Tax=Legionella sp. TaxID=459 RepID=UPI00284867CC|nr:hypothetical protein [Legionella sp.]